MSTAGEPGSCQPQAPRPPGALLRPLCPCPVHAGTAWHMLVGTMSLTAAASVPQPCCLSELTPVLTCMGMSAPPAPRMHPLHPTRTPCILHAPLAPHMHPLHPACTAAVSTQGCCRQQGPPPHPPWAPHTDTGEAGFGMSVPAEPRAEEESLQVMVGARSAALQCPGSGPCTSHPCTQPLTTGMDPNPSRGAGALDAASQHRPHWRTPHRGAMRSSCARL